MRDDILEHISYPETMDEKKKVFLTNAFHGSRNLQQKDLLPYLTQLIKETKAKNIKFTNSEIQFIINAIKNNATPDERSAIDKITNLKPEDVAKNQ